MFIVVNVRVDFYKENHLTEADVRGSNFQSEIMRAAMAAQAVKEKMLELGLLCQPKKIYF